MAISPEIREQVRQRAEFACEFCGVNEVNTGSELTVDHYRPQTKGGSDNLENLIYCCPRCNQYKSDYWPTSTDDIPLWNPREEPSLGYFIELDDGRLHPLNPIGEFTVRRLRLNRKPLIAYRIQESKSLQEIQLLARYQELIGSLETLNRQIANLMGEQKRLLEEQRELLQLILGQKR